MGAVSLFAACGARSTMFRGSAAGPFGDAVASAVESPSALLSVIAKAHSWPCRWQSKQSSLRELQRFSCASAACLASVLECACKVCKYLLVREETHALPQGFANFLCLRQWVSGAVA